MAKKFRQPGHITPPPEFHNSMNCGEWERAQDYVRSLECELVLLRRFLRYVEWRRHRIEAQDVQRAIDACKLGQGWEELC